MRRKFKVSKFLNTLGIIDDEQATIRCPPNDAIYFYNHRGFYSMVILDLVNTTKNDFSIELWQKKGLEHYHKMITQSTRIA